MAIIKMLAELSGCDTTDVQYGDEVLFGNLIFPPNAPYDLSGFCRRISADTLARLTALSLHSVPTVEVCFGENIGIGGWGCVGEFSDIEDGHWHTILSDASDHPRVVSRKEIGDIVMLDSNGLDNFFLECVLSDVIRPDLDGRWYINDRFFLRGVLPTKGIWKYAQFKKIQKDTYLQIYKNNLDNLKYIGIVLKLIPNLHTERNYICYNTDEIRGDKIVPLLPKDICRILGCKHERPSYFVDSLRDKFEEITFEYDGKMQQLCRIDRDGKEYLVMINPNVIYADNPPEFKRTCLELYWVYEDSFDLPFRRYPRNPIKGSTLAYVNRANA